MLKKILFIAVPILLLFVTITILFTKRDTPFTNNQIKTDSIPLISKIECAVDTSLYPDSILFSRWIGDFSNGKITFIANDLNDKYDVNDTINNYSDSSLLKKNNVVWVCLPWCNPMRALIDSIYRDRSYPEYLYSYFYRAKIISANYPSYRKGDLISRGPGLVYLKKPPNYFPLDTLKIRNLNPDEHTFFNNWLEKEYGTLSKAFVESVQVNRNVIHLDSLKTSKEILKLYYPPKNKYYYVVNCYYNYNYPLGICFLSLAYIENNQIITVYKNVKFSIGDIFMPIKINALCSYTTNNTAVMLVYHDLDDMFSYDTYIFYPDSDKIELSNDFIPLF
ncbi:MAG: hypothetical protein Q7U71_01710 [bacterium]|nr:hypothetical protein [bacterium]